jgi:tRNA 5-methylaminomethyl-2-thiouridine biosynthesis bifunctional protein
VDFLSAEQASNRAGIQLSQSGLFFSQAGWIDPRKLCVHLINHPNIKVTYDFTATQLSYEQSSWQVLSSKGDKQSAPVAIIANAKDALSFEHANYLPMKSIRGQVTYIPETATPASLKTVVCAEGYIGPAQEGIFCTGATFNLKDTELATRVSDHLTNLNNLREHLPAFEFDADVNNLAGRVAFRCSLPDYLPCVGGLPLVDKMVEDFAPLRKNARAGITAAGSYWPGLYINIGHGARGLAYTPLCAELLAAEINNEPAPMPRELVSALNPARFVIRDLTRSKR